MSVLGAGYFPWVATAGFAAQSATTLSTTWTRRNYQIVLLRANKRLCWIKDVPGLGAPEAFQ